MAGNFFSSHRAEWPLVAEMSDGGMGSLKFVGGEGRKFGGVVGACRFDDADGVEVVASLYRDDRGGPLELDVWKVTFEPLIAIPSPDKFWREAD
ncbi:MAG: hypothetical protein E7773_05510 [Sphingomonas sp.]|nr:MAG: hypothetical protein E7773_05510 [Sphingomonas sp.]